MSAYNKEWQQAYQNDYVGLTIRDMLTLCCIRIRMPLCSLRHLTQSTEFTQPNTTAGITIVLFKPYADKYNEKNNTIRKKLQILLFILVLEQGK